MAAVSNGRPRAIPFNPLKPFNGYGFADLVASRRGATAHCALPNRINHPVAQVLRIWLRHSCWPPPSQQVESKSLQFGNPPQFKPKTHRSRREEVLLIVHRQGPEAVHPRNLVFGEGDRIPSISIQALSPLVNLDEEVPAGYRFAVFAGGLRGGSLGYREGRRCSWRMAFVCLRS